MKQGNFLKKIVTWNWVPVLILLVYPLRHINIGLDLWDTGYNYANFQYMGLEHMDSMWLYSTYLANVTGNFLMKLPFGGSMMGMNFYTGLIVSVLAVLGYWFGVRKLQMPAWLAFVGEFLAISLCWSPTAALYHYLTYALFTVSVMLVYIGLTKEDMRYLFAAGVVLGANVLVRFSNLPQAALIVAVWAYAVIDGMEEIKNSKAVADDKEMSKTPEVAGALRKAEKKQIRRRVWSRIWRQTLWCLGGYLSALLVLFLYIHIRYGLDDYVTGILRLFAMTDTATDYKPTAMIMGLVGVYVENLYWVIRIGIIAVAGVIFYSFVTMLWETKVLAGLCNRSKGWRVTVAIIKGAAIVFCVMLAVAMLYWLYRREFCSFAFYSYDSMLRPGILFMMLAMGIALIRIFHPTCPKEEKLISGLIILLILLTSIGSNNGVYPSINNLFIAAPYTIWQSWKYITGVTEWRFKGLVIGALPSKCILAAFLAMCVFQFTLFGVEFVFVEATGAVETTAEVENNEVLAGMKMHPERAEWLQEISDYVSENELQGREVILYGWIPSMSYYLQMPSAFNPWSDLESYSVETMLEHLQETVREMENGKERPVIIVENEYTQYADGEVTGDSEDAVDEKWQLIMEFMEEYNYQKTFSNEKFTMYE